MGLSSLKMEFSDEHNDETIEYLDFINTANVFTS